MSDKNYYLGISAVAVAMFLFLGLICWLAYSTGKQNQAKDERMMSECLASGGSWVGGDAQACIVGQR